MFEVGLAYKGLSVISGHSVASSCEKGVAHRGLSVISGHGGASLCEVGVAHSRFLVITGHGGALCVKWVPPKLYKQDICYM